MEKFTTSTSVVIPLERDNVDTDAIIPKQFLKSIKRTGFGPHLFDEWRYQDQGELGQDCSKRPINPDFVLNQPRFSGASILLAGKNFGCGSSREHAPWALHEYGIRTIIAPSFADIFFNNCFKNGMLPLVLNQEFISGLFSTIATDPSFSLTVDLQSQQLIGSDGVVTSFDVEADKKHNLLQGLDEISLSLQYVDDIRAYEQKKRQETPWIFID
jgi:3-isopropylmalate/(R)-2-methylmalate dehydratase small subunit